LIFFFFLYFSIIGDCSLCSFYYTLSNLRGIKETHNCTPYAKWGVVSPKAPLRGIHSSPVLTAVRVKKNWYCCAWLVYPSGIRLLLSVTPG